MYSQSKTVAHVVHLFRAELLSIYPVREIEQFIAMSFDDVMHFSRADVQLKADAQVPLSQYSMFEAIVEGLKNQQPIQYLIGRMVFYGLPIRVNPDVLIPRPETEELVHWIFSSPLMAGAKAIDLGTGSGCIALAIKDRFKECMVYGVDNSIAALDVAMDNARRNELEVSFFQFDILRQQSLGFMYFDLMVSNPPYVTEADKAEMLPNVLNNEPHGALFVPDEDPLLFYRRIVDLADGHLNKNGWIYFEINRAFGAEVVQLLTDRNYREVELRKDFAGNDRMVRATKL